ncbi:hypothetical protein C8R46DRAFT_1197370 [Mycena filopes]|nr:hypothetical protein C8R46DRAFT_1197370 [Mycena filopes]
MAQYSPADVISSRRSSLTSITSITSFASTASGNIIVTERHLPARSSSSCPAPVPPPFAFSLGSDERLPPPRRGAPTVAPAKNRKDSLRKSSKSLVRALLRRKAPLNPALCEGWWYVIPLREKCTSKRSNLLSHPYSCRSFEINLVPPRFRFCSGPDMR